MKQIIKNILNLSKESIEKYKNENTTPEWWEAQVEIAYNTLKEIEPKTFEEASRPLMKWMAENCHPHTTSIIGSTTAELLESTKCFNTDEYLVD